MYFIVFEHTTAAVAHNNEAFNAFRYVCFSFNNFFDHHANGRNYSDCWRNKNDYHIITVTRTSVEGRLANFTVAFEIKSSRLLKGIQA